MEKTKNTHGGRRQGAGRPRTGSKLYAFRADGNVAQAIDSSANKSGFITDCISKVLKMQSIGEVYHAADVKPLHLPYFDISVVAGFPIPLDNDELAQDIELLRMLCPNPEASYLIRVEGNSMIDADIHSGDLLIVDKSNRNPMEHEVALCELNGEYTIKYVHSRGGKWRLVPANASFPEIEISQSDSFNVWGVVTYIIHKPRG
ncbi:MAG: LexA family protein [Muribaculaceae bacterium]